MAVATCAREHSARPHDLPDPGGLVPVARRGSPGPPEVVLGIPLAVAALNVWLRARPLEAPDLPTEGIRRLPAPLARAEAARTVADPVLRLTFAPSVAG